MRAVFRRTEKHALLPAVVFVSFVLGLTPSQRISLLSKGMLVRLVGCRIELSNDASPFRYDIGLDLDFNLQRSRQESMSFGGTEYHNTNLCL
jgi:hypothetical protein